MRLGANCPPAAYEPAATPDDDGTEAVQASSWDPRQGVHTEHAAGNPLTIRTLSTEPPAMPPSTPEARPNHGPLAAFTTSQDSYGGTARPTKFLHVEQRNGVTTPAGAMTPRTPHRNTWRAPAQPWDYGVFVGMPEQGTGQ